MRQATTVLEIETDWQGLVEITAEIANWVADAKMSDGLLTIFCRHTSASLLIQENAAPEVRSDLEAYFARIAPEDASYAHDDEGPDDMPAHLRAGADECSTIDSAYQWAIVLGTWQGIYLFEHRRHPHRRSLVLHLLGGMIRFLLSSNGCAGWLGYGDSCDEPVALPDLNHTVRKQTSCLPRSRCHRWRIRYRG